MLPEARPERLVLISGGSGITPVMSMLRTLCDEQHAGEITFIHYARTAADWLYRAEVAALAARHPNVSVDYVATREGGERFCARPELEGALVAVCGPPALIDAVQAEVGPGRLLAETFTPPSLTVTGEAADGTAPLPALAARRADRGRDAARAGRGRGAVARVRLPDGDLPHMQVPQERGRRPQPPHR